MSVTGAINWDAVHQKLAAFPGADALAPLSPAVVEGILAQRAVSLARRQDAAPDAVHARMILLVRVSGQLAGIAVEGLREILRLESFAPVPDAHEWVLGVMNAHNELVSLVDTRRVLNLPAAEAATFKYALVLQHQQLRVALGCDEVLSLQDLPAAQEQERDFFNLGDEVGALIDPEDILGPWSRETILNSSL